MAARASLKLTSLVFIIETHAWQTAIYFDQKRIYITPSESCILDLPPARMPVTTRILTFFVGNPYKPSFVTDTGCGVDPTCIY